MKAILLSLLALSFFGCGKSSSNNSGPVVVGPFGDPLIDITNDELGESATVALRGREKEAVFQALTDYGRILYLIDQSQNKNDHGRSENPRGRNRASALIENFVARGRSSNSIFQDENLATSVLADLTSQRCNPNSSSSGNPGAANSETKFTTRGATCPLRINSSTRTSMVQSANVLEWSGGADQNFVVQRGSRLDSEDIKSGSLKISGTLKRQSNSNNSTRTDFAIIHNANLMSSGLSNVAYTMKGRISLVQDGVSAKNLSYIQIKIASGRLTAVLSLIQKNDGVTNSTGCTLNKERLSQEQCEEMNSMLGKNLQ